MPAEPLMVDLLWEDGEPYISLREAADILEAEALGVHRVHRVQTPEEALRAMATQWRSEARRLKESGTPADAVVIPPSPPRRWFQFWRSR